MSKPRRPKNESGPAQSGAFSNLASHADPFAAFTSFGGAAVDTTDTLPSDFAQAFKRLTKKDAATKVSACTTLHELLSTAEEGDVILAIPEVVAAVKRRYYSKDKHLRRCLCRCLHALFSRGKTVKNKCVPHLGQLLGPWLCLRFDREAEVAAAANEAWDAAFDSVDRTKNAIAHCQDKLVLALQLMLTTTVEQLKDEDGLRPEEAAEILENMQTSCLSVCCYLVKLAAGDTKMQGLLDQLATDLFDDGKLLKLGESKMSKVRACVYTVLSSYLQHAVEYLEPNAHALTVFLQNSFGEKAPEVHGDMWPTVLLWMKKMPDGIRGIKNIHTTVFQKLYALLRKSSGISGSRVTYASLLPFLMLLGSDTIVAGDQSGARFLAFADEFLTSLWNGMQSNSLPVSEVPLLLASWAECWNYLTAAIPKALPSPHAPAEHHMVTAHLKPAVRHCLISPFRLGSKYVIEKILPALSKAACIPSLHQPLVAMWTEILDEFTDGAAFGVVHEAKKSKKIDYESLNEPNVDKKTALKRLAQLLGNFRHVAATPEVREYLTEVAVLTGTFLINTLTSTGDDLGPEVVACWQECRWDLVPKLLHQAYGSIIKPCLGKALRGESKGHTCVAAMDLSSLLVMAKALLEDHEEEAVEVLTMAKDCKDAAVVVTLARGVATGCGSAVVRAWEELAKVALRNCIEEPEQWSTAVSEVLATVPHARISALETLQEAVEKAPSTALLTTLMDVLTAAQLPSTSQQLWDDLMSFVVTTLLGKSCEPTMRHLLDEWSAEVSRCPSSGNVVSTTTEALERHLQAGSMKSTDVCRAVYNLQCLQGFTLDVGILDKLWGDVSLRVEECTTLLKNLYLLEGPALHAEAAGLAPWVDAVKVFVMHSETSLDMALHYCKAKLLADAGLVNYELGQDCEHACERILSSLPVAETAKKCHSMLDGHGAITTLCSIYILRQLITTQDGDGQLALVTSALESKALTVMQLAISQRCHKEVPEEVLEAVTEWCSEIAEMDEVGEPVEDDQILTALQVCLWVPKSETVEEIIGVLASAASERLQADTPSTAWGLRLKLCLALALIEQSEDSITEVAPLAASLLQKYRPSQKFAWTHSDTAMALPVEGCLYHPLSLLVTSCTSDKVDVGSKVLLLTVIVDTLVFLSTKDLKADEQESVVLLCECLANVGAADMELLSPEWGAVVCKMFIDTCKEVSALPVEGTDDEATDDSLFAVQHVVGPQKMVLTLAGMLGRLDADMLVEGELPEAVKTVVDLLLAVGKRLDGNQETSQNTFKTVVQTQEGLYRNTLLLQCYLIGWYLLLSLVDRTFYDVSTEGSPIKGALTEAIKDTDGLKPLMNIISGLLLTPKWVVLKTLEPEAETPESPVNDQRNTMIAMTNLPADLNITPLYLSRFSTPGDMGLSCVVVLNKLLSTIPSAPRRWVSDCEPTLRESVNNFVINYLSPDLIRKELNYVVEKGGGKHTFSPCDELKVRVQPNACSVILEYDYQDTIVSVKMVVPPSFPLDSIQHPSLDAQVTRAKAGLREDVWRRWLMQMTAKLLNKSARLWDCVQLWQQNLTKHFDGQDPCPICYQVVNTTTQQLPSMECSCCKGKYHKLCLYKWFKQSNNSTCPLCRAAWCAGAPTPSQST
eukprot:TRINITY_DN22153_c0_g2_i1.p1 TRINITY_DN22153_c0_g2~~TRINITY_DN22153_c0_g2_i1.p1  ORF type:complete len:1645 (+),score=449.29 TRINITY_DN22153_c0_g2_i1:38-4936(+)